MASPTSPLTLDLEADGLCQVSGSAGRTTLRKTLGGGVSLLAVPADGGAGHDLARRLAEVPTPTGVRRHLLTRADTMTRNPRGIDVISDSTGALVSAHSGPRDQLYLVRPDCHLAVRIELADPDALAGAVERALGIFAPTPPARPVPRPRARDRDCSSQWI